MTTGQLLALCGIGDAR